MQEITELPLCPSFNCYSSGRLAEIAAKVSDEFNTESQVSVDDGSLNNQPQQSKPIEEEQLDDDDDFEFALVRRDSGDEVFYDRQIRQVFPIFNRDLLLDHDSEPPDVSSLRIPLKKLFIEEERDPPSSSSSSEADELDRIPPGTYCVWTPSASPSPSPGRCKKSNSTGTSSSKRWRFRDLLGRSNSDGKDAFVFLTPSAAKKREEKTEKAETTKEGRSSGEVKVVGKVKSKGVTGEKMSAHEIFYTRNRALKEGDKRRSFLPYRQPLVGFFANMNGLGNPF